MKRLIFLGWGSVVSGALIAHLWLGFAIAWPLVVYGCAMQLVGAMWVRRSSPTST